MLVQKNKFSKRKEFLIIARKNDFPNKEILIFV